MVHFCVTFMSSIVDNGAEVACGNVAAVVMLLVYHSDEDAV
jgi:hypothetical protein